VDVGSGVLVGVPVGIGWFRKVGMSAPSTDVIISPEVSSTGTVGTMATDPKLTGGDPISTIRVSPGATATVLPPAVTSTRPSWPVTQVVPASLTATPYSLP